MADGQQTGGFLAKLVMLVLGLFVGIFSGAVMLDRPDAVFQAYQFVRSEIAAVWGGDREALSLLAAGMAVMVGFLSCYILMRSAALFGILIGLFAWVPLGAHILYAAPDLRGIFPALAPNLEIFVSANGRLDTLRNLGLAILPLPEDKAALVPRDTESAGDEARRLPQITQ